MTVFAAVFLFLLGIFFIIHHFTPPVSKDSFSPEFENQPAVLENPSKDDVLDEKAYTAFFHVQRPVLGIGVVTIADITDVVLSRIPVPVLSGGWIALPLEICYGGFHWSYSDEPGNINEIQWGMLHDNDEVGLWWVEGASGARGGKISPWDHDRPLYWVSIVSDDPPVPVYPENLVEQGYLVRIEKPSFASEPGIFFQEDRIVGWSFGKLAGHAYLWTGMEGEKLTYDLRVEDFYRLTFAGSREEAFALALAQKGITDGALLSSLAQGFGLPSKISEVHIPSRLRQEAIVKKIRALVSKLISKGDNRSVSDSFDDQALIQINSPPLAADVVYAVMKTEGNEIALLLLEAVRPHIALDTESALTRLNRLHKHLYLGRLADLMNDFDFYGMALALDHASTFFPEDPEIHLWRVKLALEQNDWREARRLLYARQYPMNLQDAVINLENRITTLKNQEEKIVIRFTPGSHHIPVRALLNNTLHQDFIIDTGATVTAIPYETAKGLGINIDDSCPIRRLYTAGGVIRARQVNLSTLQIGQWVVHDIKALVVNLPRQKGTGLLGLNYLNRFDMEMNAEKGILTLAPH